jgi:hypothetical protein
MRIIDAYYRLPVANTGKRYIDMETLRRISTYPDVSKTDLVDIIQMVLTEVGHGGSALYLIAPRTAAATAKAVVGRVPEFHTSGGGRSLFELIGHLLGRTVRSAKTK